MVADNTGIGEGFGRDVTGNKTVSNQPILKRGPNDRPPKRSKKIIPEFRRNSEDKTISNSKERQTNFRREERDRAVGTLTLALDIPVPDFQSILSNSNMKVIPFSNLDEVKQSYSDTELFALLIHTDSDLDRWVPELEELHQLAPHIRQLIVVDSSTITPFRWTRPACACKWDTCAASPNWKPPRKTARNGATTLNRKWWGQARFCWMHSI